LFPARTVQCHHVNIAESPTNILNIKSKMSDGSSLMDKEIKIVVGGLAVHKGGNGNNEDTAEIRRIVTLIARAMPSVARQV